MNHTELIRATPEACFAAAIDYASYPSWQSLVKEVTVHSRDDAGRGEEVEFVVDLKIATVRYTLRYAYPGATKITWTYVGGDAKDVSGSYTFSPTEAAEIAEARYELKLELPVSVPAVVRNRIQREAMKRTVVELKRRVEADASGRPARMGG
jgi:ribosome-associated toxin RatA of RatAB toxin-antitoxin module